MIDITMAVVVAGTSTIWPVPNGIVELPVASAEASFTSKTEMPEIMAAGLAEESALESVRGFDCRSEGMDNRGETASAVDADEGFLVGSRFDARAITLLERVEAEEAVGNPLVAVLRAIVDVGEVGPAAVTVEP